MSDSITITLRPGSETEESRTLNIAAIPFKERLVCRKATGMPLESFMVDQEAGAQAVGIDTVQVWWWLAGRKLNPVLTLDQSLKDWPDEIDEDTLDVSMESGEDDDPEA